MTPRPIASLAARLALIALVSVAALVASPSLARAEPSLARTDEDAALPTVRRTIPDPLKPWVGWALRAHPEVSCPSGADGARVCVFPSKLRLEATARGARFELTATTDAPAALPLPGDAAQWPTAVQLDGRAAAVVRDESGNPVVHVAAGTHAVRGEFAWKKRPDAVRVPPAVAIVVVTLDGKPLAHPTRDDAGRLHLSAAEVNAGVDGEENEPELRVRVVRRLEDDVPASLVTRLVLDVSGREREIVLGPALPEGFVATAIETLVPVTLDASGALHLRPSAGHWEIVVAARSTGPVARVARPKAGEPWPAEEVWSFAARPELRAVGVEGGAAIDPRTWPMPDDWKRLPAYALGSAGELRLNEQVRGAAAAPPDDLALRRELWLDFDGAGFTARDTITGNLNRSWRFAALAPLELGHATSDGEHVLVTRGEAGEGSGFEVRGLRANVVAESRIARGGDELPVAGWAADFHTVSARLHLPVGYRLIAAPGVDTAPDAWVARWRLADLFVLLVTSFAVARLAGVASGAGAFFALGLALVEPGSPRTLWLAGVVALALARLAPERFAKSALALRVLCMLSLATAALPFVRDELRTALYPALASQEVPSARGDAEEPRPDEPQAVESEETAEAPAAPAPDFAQKGLGLEGAGIGAGGGAGASLEALGSGARLDVRGGAKLSAPFVGRKRASYIYAQQAAPAGPYQTGPGVPAWNGRVATLSWSGPVARGESMRLVLAPPLVTRALGVARALLVLALLAVMAGGRGAFEKIAGHIARGRSSARLASLALLVAASSARAEMPSDAMLKELADELLANPTCFPHCAALEAATLDAEGDALTVSVEAHAAAPTLLPLPAAEGWSLTGVDLDGRDAPIVRAPGGALWLRLDAGTRRIVMRGQVRARDRIDLPFPMAPARVDVRGRGWRVDGLDPEGHPSGQTVVLVREGALADRASSPRDAQVAVPRDLALAALVRIERSFRVDLGVSVESRVVRLGPATAAVDLRVPLLDGELPSTVVAASNERVVEVHLDPGATEFAWTSALPEGAPLHLVASSDPRTFERWALSVGHGWRFEASGTTPIRTTTAPRELVWLPWPGEKVDATFTRLASAEGATLTIDRADLTTTPGARTTDHTLALRLRVSHGGEHRVTIPGEVELTSFRVNGAEQPLRLEASSVVIPLTPGTLDVTITWRAPGGLRAILRTPAVQLGAPAVNVTTRLALAADRFTLLTGGPTFGPAVLLWGTVAFVALLASLLGRVPYAPLGAVDWFLLALGLTQGPLEGLVFAVLFFFGLGARARAPEALGRFAYNGSQLVLALLGLLAFAALYEAVERGFVGAPDVAIAGGGSSAGNLVWFVDRTPGTMPTGGALTLPTWAYRLTMLAWSLWIAAALIRWARWAGEAFTAQGPWVRRPSTPAIAAPPTEAAAASTTVDPTP
jgi:hypothetical protein